MLVGFDKVKKDLRQEGQNRSLSINSVHVLTSVHINCSVLIHNIKALIKKDVGIPPSLLPSIGHPNTDNN